MGDYDTHQPGCRRKMPGVDAQAQHIEETWHLSDLEFNYLLEKVQCLRESQQWKNFRECGKAGSSAHIGRSWHSLLVILEQGLGNYGPQATSSLLHVFMIKIYWNTVTCICLHFGYGCFNATVLELTGCSRDHMACKAKNICYLLFSRKWLLTSVLE